MTQVFNYVICQGWSSDPEKTTYGTLQEAGYLTKEYKYHRQGILWTVVGDIQFTNNFGQTFKKGDTDFWEK